MKEILKNSIIVIVLIMLIYCLFIVEEFVRVRSSLREPLIIFDEQYSYDEVTYVSFGYTLKRKFYCKSDDLCFLDSEEFWLFDKILIWGWIN